MGRFALQGPVQVVCSTRGSIEGEVNLQKSVEGVSGGGLHHQSGDELLMLFIY